MLINRNSVNRGDTLIEVLFAVTVFSLVAVGALSIMNQGTATAQRALEITLVRQEIDAQAETLRFLNASYIADTPASIEWRYIKVQANLNLSVTDFNTNSPCVTPPSNSFVLNTHTAKFEPPSDMGKPGLASTFSQVRYSNNDISAVEGIWIEAFSSATSSDTDQANAGYIDFHIRACWDSPGQSVPVTLGTIVRLYEPR